MHLTSKCPRGRLRSRSGFTLVDVALASTILIVAAGGLIGTVLSTSRLARTTEESSDAYEAARAITETIYATDATDVFATFTAASNFAVPGLNIQDGDADGFVGQIVFPTIGGQLREDSTDGSLGMPRDLNGDGVIDALDHSGDYVILPLTIRMQWQGVSGDQTADLTLLLEN